MKMTKLTALIASLIICIGMTSCASVSRTADSSASGNSSISADNAPNGTSDDKQAGSADGSKQESSEQLANAAAKLDTSDIFSKRDLKQEADLTDAERLTVKDGETLEITKEGVYVISGSAKNCTVKVTADKEAKVQLVLDGVTITNDDFPAVYVVSADKCFITTTDKESNLSVSGDFRADGDTKTDAVIFSKDDLVFNGLGKLTISSARSHGISGKDDLKFTGGSYVITSAKHSIEANDSISISDGTFELTSSTKDGMHCENDDDDTLGYIYISGGTFKITAKSDAIQGTTITQIDGGTFDLKSAEGIESTYIQINGGDINISASDDGVNAAKKSASFGTPTIEINGGMLTIVMGQGDVDALDANGNIIVNGGTIDITITLQGPAEAFDCDGTATYNGGVIIINGEQVDEIPKSMMGGGMGGGKGGMGGNRPGRFDKIPGADGGFTRPDGFDPNDLPEGFKPGKRPDGDFGKDSHKPMAQDGDAADPNSSEKLPTNV